jgi:hypothetical protein
MWSYVDVDESKGYINRLCGETLADSRMGVPPPTTNSFGLSVILIETPCKAAINAPCLPCQDARKPEEWLDMQPQRFVMLGINADSYNAVVWVTSHLHDI